MTAAGGSTPTAGAARPEYDLDQRVAVVTGGAAGIGAATALLLARCGATVYVLDVDMDSAGALQRQAESAAGAVVPISTDVTAEDSVAAAFDRILERSGGVDVLHANAGIEWTKPVLDTSYAEWRRVIGVNLDGVYLACRYAMSNMVARGSGAVVITSSPHAERTVPDAGAYAAAKGGTLALMRALSLEGAPRGVRVNAVLPGAIDTPMLQREAQVAVDPAAQLAAFGGMQPLGRLGRPEEIAETVVFLASRLSSFTTGSCFYVDGGGSAVLPSGPPLPYGGAAPGLAT